MLRELEARPAVIVFLGLLIGLSCGVALWHALFILPFSLLPRPVSRHIALTAFLVGFLIQPDFRTPLPINRSFFAGEATVISVPRTTKTGNLRLVVEGKGRRFAMYVPPGSDLAYRDRIRLRGVVKPLSDGAHRARGETGVIEPVSAIEPLGRGLPVWRWGREIVSSFSGFVSTSVGDRRADLIEALCFNMTTDISPEFWQALRKTGTPHIVSTSGLHLMITAMLLLGVLRGLPIPRAWQIALLILALVVYASASGLRPPVIRAVIMAGVGFSAFLFRREPDGLSAVTAAGAAYLLFEPSGIADIGFQLSIAAVTGLVLFMGPAPKADRGRPLHAFGSWVGALAKASLIASLATLPIIALAFGEISLISVLANLLVVPVLAVVIGAALGGWIISGVLPSLGSWMLVSVAGPIVAWIIAVIEVLAAAPFASVSVPWFSPYWLVAFYGLAILLWRPHVRTP